MGIFKQKKIDTNEKITENEKEKIEMKELEEKVLYKDTNGYVWIEGYKGTDKNMCCQNDFQYELGVEVSLPEDEEPVVCKRGFHFCPELKDVFCYYGISKNHRFFKCKALVKKEDAEKGYSEERVPHGNSVLVKSSTIAHGIKKIVAKKIILTEEIEITTQDCIDWAANYGLIITKDIVDYTLDKKGELTIDTIKISMFELYIEKVNELLGSNCAYLLKSKTSGGEKNYYYFNALIELGYDKKEIFDKMIEFN